MDTKEVKDVKKTAPIDRARFHLAEHYQQGYVAIVPQGTDPRDLEDPAYFANVAFMCRASGRIFVECEDGTWLADMYIRAVGPQYVMARILNVWDMADFKPESEGQTTEISGFKVQWSGMYTKWRVVRLSDNAVVSKDHETKGSAEGWLREHLKAVKA